MRSDYVQVKYDCCGIDIHKKAFLLVFLHHHYQMKGMDETAVTLRFWLVHAVGAVILSLLMV